MFEFRLRILDVREREEDPRSFLGIVEGFPQILNHSTSIEQAEIDIVNSLIQHLKRLQDQQATRLEVDDFPMVRAVRPYVAPLGSQMNLKTMDLPIRPD